MSIKDQMDKLKSRLFKMEAVVVAADKGQCCGFCGSLVSMDRPGACSVLSGTTICASCLTYIRMGLDELPAGAVVCLRCKNYNGVKISYPGATVEFVFGGLDKELGVLYIVQSTTGTWRRDTKPSKAACVSCAASIPLWMLSFNKYIGTVG